MAQTAVVLLRHAVERVLMLLARDAQLLLPLFVHYVLLGDECLIPLHLHHDLLLVLRLELLRLLRVPVFKLLQLVLVLDLQRVPRLHQHVVLALRLFELGVEVVARLLELLAVGHVFEPQLILALHRQLLHLLLELRHRLRLLLEVGARDERLLRKRDRLAHELRTAAVLIAQVKDEEGGVLRHREDEGVVRRDAQPGDGR
mmetsp:Transcript_27671/g.82726  ORF Transcript_27671/g.82726 Transcript_27671/m.82726 type:complete len:201 (-) Transcript_27671:1771-2373(-)